MIRTRVIPVLLLKGEGLYKGEKFKNHTYVGDPINTVKIFNEKRVDELVLLDIEASLRKSPINYSLIEEIATEAFMPVGYGGGINAISQAQKLFSLGIEKIILNTSAIENPAFVQELVETFGSQSIVFSLDTKPDLFGKARVYYKSGTKKSKEDALSTAIKMQARGVGEIIMNSIHLEGSGKGYDLKLINKLTQELEVPLIALGGASNVEDMIAAKEAGAHGLAAGSLFVFQGPLKGVLITYLSENELNRLNQ